MLSDENIIVVKNVQGSNKEKKKYDYYSDPDYRKKLLTHLSEKINCECGRVVSRSCRSKHIKSGIHQQHMKFIQDAEKNKKYHELDSLVQEISSLDKDQQQLLNHFISKLNIISPSK